MASVESELQTAIVARLKADALAKDAMNGPTTWPPMGSWAGARIGRSDSRKSRWNGSNL